MARQWRIWLYENEGWLVTPWFGMLISAGGKRSYRRTVWWGISLGWGRNRESYPVALGYIHEKLITFREIPWDDVAAGCAGF